MTTRGGCGRVLVSENDGGGAGTGSEGARGTPTVTSIGWISGVRVAVQGRVQGAWQMHKGLHSFNDYAGLGRNSPLPR